MKSVAVSARADCCARNARVLSQGLARGSNAKILALVALGRLAKLGGSTYEPCGLEHKTRCAPLRWD